MRVGLNCLFGRPDMELLENKETGLNALWLLLYSVLPALSSFSRVDILLLLASFNSSALLGTFVS